MFEKVEDWLVPYKSRYGIWYRQYISDTGFIFVTCSKHLINGFKVKKTEYYLQFEKNNEMVLKVSINAMNFVTIYMWTLNIKVNKILNLDFIFFSQSFMTQNVWSVWKTLINN